jgi:hypothetical protein
MSFVITSISPETVVQVSDMRISAISDKSVLSDKHRKSIVVMGRQAQFVLGWVGLAKAGKHDTGDWVYQRLYEMNAVDLPLDQIAGNLTDLATRHFATLPLSEVDRRCHFVLGGWHKDSGVPKAFRCVIYNDLVFHAAEGHNAHTLVDAPVAASQFLNTIGSFATSATAKRQYDVFVTGDFTPRKLTAHFSGLKALMKRPAGAAAISAACRQIALEAARHTATISRSLISVEMDKRGGVRCSYHSEDGAEVMFIPDILSTQGTLLKSTVATSIVGDQITLKLRGKTVRPAG